MLHRGKTFATHDPRTFAAVCSAGGSRYVLVQLHGHRLTLHQDQHGRLIWPRHIPRLLKKQTQRAFTCKIALDNRFPPC